MSANAERTPLAVYEEGLRALRALHALYAQGQGDGHAADLLREDLDAPWWAMTSAEQTQMRGLSQQLYDEAEKSTSERSR